jgi:molecular chaperone DnaJ
MAMPQQQDLYEVLGVSKSATDEEIRKAYLKLAHKYHPDKTGGDKQAEDKLKEINSAYDTLKNPDKRAKYDQFGAAGEGFSGGFNDFGGGFSSAPFEDFFDVLFGRGPGGQGGRRSAQPGNDLEYRMSITLREAAFGAKKTIRFARKEVCGDCTGTGAAAGTTPQRCADCGGTGQIRRAQGFFSVSTTCNKCRGKGAVITKPCTRCTGTGRIRETFDKSVTIPPGIDTGSRLRLAGEGEPGGGGGPRGDLYIYIEVKPDEIFERDGTDIICEVPITFPQAALGATIKVPTLKGEEELKIPAGTQPGHEFRLRGQGMPDVRGYHRGDEIIRVQLEVPSKLTKEERELIKRLSDASNTQEYPLIHRFMERLKKSLGA